MIRLEEFRIEDWAGNICFNERFNDWYKAEDFLSGRLGDDYETDRGEYYILRENENE